MSRHGLRCANWSRFETQREAMRALARKRKPERVRFKRDRRRCFFCTACGGWHHGHWLSAWIG